MKLVCLKYVCDCVWLQILTLSARAGTIKSGPLAKALSEVVGAGAATSYVNAASTLYLALHVLLLSMSH